jgi:putative ABC transport system permease protein
MHNKFWFRLLEWFCPSSLYEGIEGDLLEAYDLDRATKGRRIANMRLAWNVIRFFRPSILLRNRFRAPLSTIMFGSYVKVASRNIAKRKLYSFINAFGLSIATAFCTLIYLYVQDEKSFDQFHQNREHIYQILTSNFEPSKFESGDPVPYSRNPYMPAALGDVMLDELPEVQHMTRFVNYNQGIMRYGTNAFTQKFTGVDSGFFKMFSFKILAGDSRNPLRNVSDAVLTPAVAHKYFGDENPIGKIFTMDSNGDVKSFTVTAIIEAPPANSSLVFDMLVPMDAIPWFVSSRSNWGSSSFPTFVQVHPGTHTTTLKMHLDTLFNTYMAEHRKYLADWVKPPAGYEPRVFEFQNLSDIHLANDIYWDRVSDAKYSWILGGIAVMILIIAAINYISLALTTSASRRVEVGIRKVVGAQKSQIAWQFTLESLLLSLISMFVGLALVGLFLPSFNQFTMKGIALTSTNMVAVIGVAFGVAALVGLLAGSYPAIFLSNFLPARVLKGRFTSRLQVGFTKPLVVLQFFLSTSMIICSVIMYQQMNYISTKDLGFNKEQVVVIPTQTGWNARANKTVEQFRNAIETDPVVMGVSGVTSSFSRGWSRRGFRVNGETKDAFVYGVDTRYIPLLEIELTLGRNFDGNIASDSSAVIVNEAMVRNMKWKDPLQEYLNWQEDSTGPGAKVIGVVKDYHYMSLEHSVEPMLISLKAGVLTNVLVKLTSGDLPEKVARLKQTWTTLFPDRPFEYTFLDQDLAAQYDMHERWSKIMGLSTIFAILIACLGLFGLAGVNAVNRTKEIGIRKVMGAQLASIFILMNKQYLWLAAIAFVLSIPVSWYVMQQWLGTFKFAITVGWEIFAFSLMAGLTVALLTVSYHAIRVALINPASTLKAEL